MLRSFLVVTLMMSIAFAGVAGCGRTEPAAPAAPPSGEGSVGPGAPGEGAGTPAASAPRGTKAITVKIGVVIPETGAIATYGSEALKGFSLAAANAKAEGLVEPVLVKVDNGGSQQLTASGVKQFIDAEKVSAILGPITSNNAIAAGDLAEAAGVPLVTPSATNIDVTRNRKYVFRVCFTDDVQGSTVANFAYDTLGRRRAAVLINNSESYSRGLSTPIIDTFKARGGEVVSIQSFMADTDDFSGQISQLRPKMPDVVFLPAYYEAAAKCISQARAAGLRAVFVGTDGWDSPKLHELGGDAVRNNYFSTHFSPQEDRPVVQRFVRQYRAEYKEEPGAIAALSYDAAALVFDAVKRAGSSDRQAITEALAATVDFEGVTGRFSIDAAHNPVKSIFMLETVQGSAQIKQIMAPAGAR